MRRESARGKENEKAYGKTKLQGYEDWLGNENTSFELQERRQGLRRNEKRKPSYGAHG